MREGTSVTFCEDLDCECMMCMCCGDIIWEGIIDHAAHQNWQFYVGFVSPWID